MSSVDERVVEMKFNHKAFGEGIKETLQNLEALKQGLNLEHAAQGIDSVAKAGSKFSLAGMAEGIQTVASKFNAMGAIGFTVIQSLTNAVLGFVSQQFGTMLDPLVQGGARRAQSIEQAKFQFKGLGMDIQASMDAALYAVKGTSFGLDEAAKAAAGLGASQVPLESMGGVLRGISGVAALTGSSYGDIADVFQNVAGQGRLMGDDLNRLASRGMNAAATLGKALGKTEPEIRDMVSKGEIDFMTFANIMNNTFGDQATKASDTFSGALANMNAALSRIGASFFTNKFEAQRQIFNAMAPAIDKVATALAPMQQVLADIMLFSADKIVKGINALDFTQITEAMGPFSEGIRNIFNVLYTVLTVVQSAFADVFPPSAAGTLAGMAEGFRVFTAALMPTADGLDVIKGVARGFFSAISVGISIIKGIVGLIIRVGSAIFQAIQPLITMATGFVTAGTGMAIFMNSGDKVERFFETVGDFILKPIDKLKEFARWISEVGTNITNMLGVGQGLGFFEIVGNAIRSAWEGLGDMFQKIGKFFEPMVREVGNFFRDVGPEIKDAFSNLDFQGILGLLNAGLFGAILLAIRNFFANFGKVADEGGGGIVQTIKDVFGGLTDTFAQMQQTLKSATLVAIAVAIALLTASVVALSMIDPAKLSNALVALSIMFGQLFTSMTLFGKFSSGADFANIVKVTGAMILLGIAINIMAVALKKLSEMDWLELARGLSALTVMLGLLAGTSKLLSGQNGPMIRTGVALILLATAIRILVISVTELAGMDWVQLAKGLTGVAVLLGSLVLFNKFVEANKGAIGSSLGLILLAVAIKLLVDSVSVLGSMDMGKITQGMVSLGGVMAMMILFTKATPNPNVILASAASMILMGSAIKIIASAVADFGAIAVNDLIKGLVGMAGALLIIAKTMDMMPKNMIVSAVSLIAVGAALLLISDAFAKMGGMSWDEIGRGLVVLAGSLLIIAGAMYLMSAALPGAAALLVVAAALTLFAPVMQILGSLSWDEIGRGLTVLAAGLGIVAVMGVLLIPAAVAFTVLGIALMLIAGAIVLAASGMASFAAALTALGAVAALGAAALTAALTLFIAQIPALMQAIGQGLIAFAGVIAQSAPAMAAAFIAVIQAIVTAIGTTAPMIITLLVDILTKLIAAIVELVPQIVDAAVVLITSLVNALIVLIPMLVDAGLQIIVGILTGIANNIGGIVEQGTNIIVNFLNGISAGLPRIIDAGINLIISFVQGLADGIRNNTERMNAAGADLAAAIVEGMTSGIKNGIDAVVNAAKNLAQNALQAAKDLLGIKSPSRRFREIGEYMGEGTEIGINNSTPRVVSATEAMGKAALDTMKASIAKFSELSGDDMDIVPTIRPVLDLSAIKTESQRINGMLTPDAINASDAYANAASIAQSRRQVAEENGVSETSGGSVTVNNFELNQTNNSPKALPASEIYRNTKNQMSQVKELLEV